MNFDFESMIDRRKSMSIKWAFPHHYLSSEAQAADPLPMWVADMDFRAPPVVQQALYKAVDDGIFGYSQSTDSYDDAVIDWQERRFGWRPDPHWIVKTPGVVSALAHIVQAFTATGDGVLIQTPVYAPFHNIPVINGRRSVEAPLVEDEHGYRIDLPSFERVVREQSPKLFILCNPHNPTGNIWTEEDLRGMAEICLRHGVLVVSDEIHQDLIFDRSKRHLPLASLSSEIAANSITCTAPSKTFNLAGLQVSNLFVPDPGVRDLLKRQLDCAGHHFVNALGMVACEAAYRDGEPWLEALLDHIASQHHHLAERVRSELSPLRVMPTAALYLGWIDCRRLGLSGEKLQQFLLTEARVWFDSGTKFGQQGEGFARINLGCTRATLDEALNRLKIGLNSHVYQSELPQT